MSIMDLFKTQPAAPKQVPVEQKDFLTLQLLQMPQGMFQELD